MVEIDWFLFDESSRGRSRLVGFSTREAVTETDWLKLQRFELAKADWLIVGESSDGRSQLIGFRRE